MFSVNKPGLASGPGERQILQWMLFQPTNGLNNHGPPEGIEPGCKRFKPSLNEIQGAVELT
jgi:hypothetical protein